MPHSAAQVIRFVIIRNPLVPDVKQIEEREFTPGKPLSDYIGELRGRYAFSINGRVVDQSDLGNEVPSPNDVIAIAPMPAGGGGGSSKNIIRIVAIVALTVFTYGQSTWAMGTWAAGAGTMGAVAQAAVMIGGTMLINAMLPMSMKNAQSSSSQSSTYGIDGAKNTSTENIATPVVYGRHRQAGNIIGNYTTMEGQTQYLHMLVNAGEGVIAGIDKDSILINEQPLSSLTDVEHKVFYGNDDQDSSGIFDRQITPNQVLVNRDLKKADTWTVYTTSIEKDVEGVRIDLLANIYKLDKKGNQVGHYVDIVAELKPYDAGDDQYVPLTTGISSSSGTNNTWYIDLAGKVASQGKTVVEVQTGTQAIDPTRPNIFDPETGQYKNHYKLDGSYYKLSGQAVTPNGDLTTTYYSVYVGSKGDREWVKKSKPENTVAESTLPKYSSGLKTYAYGDLMCDGVKIGTFHKFHPVNKWVPKYNGNGPKSGTAGGQVIRLTGSDASATLRFSYESPRLPAGRYSVRVRRAANFDTSSSVGNSVVFNEVAEIIYSDVAYNYTAMLYLKIKVSDQIGSVPQVSFENQGRIIRVWDESTRRWVPSADIVALGVPITGKERNDFPTLTDEQNRQSVKRLGTLTPNRLALDIPPHLLPKSSKIAYTNGFYRHDNPAWISWDMLTDDLFGAGIDPSRLDFWAFKKWADYCEAKKLSFRAVIDSRDSLWDAIAAVFRVGRATPVRTGTRYTVSVEMPKEPVMSFGSDNIIEGSFTINWMSINDRANEVELTYYDEAYDYKQRTIKVYDRAALARGAKAITSAIKVVGIVTEEQAVREANFSLNANKLVETVSFTAPVEALACTVGSLVSVQHNMMTWGEAGKIESVEATGAPGQYRLTLDHPVLFEASKDWHINLQIGVVSRGRFTVKSSGSGYVALTGFNIATVGRVKRAIIGGVETQVLDTFTSSNGDRGIVLRDFDGATVGATVELFDTDVMVSTAATPDTYDRETSVVTVSGLTQSPSHLEHFMLGFSGFTARLFTIRSIGLTGDDMTRQITALEYDERTFSDTDTDFIVKDDAYERTIGAPTSIEIVEVPVYGLAELTVRLTVSWLHTSANYRDSEVKAIVNDNQVINLGRKLSQASVDVKPGDHVDFIITPYSIGGKEGTSAKVGATPIGLDTSTAPDAPTGGQVDAISGGAKLSGLDFDQYQTRSVEVWCVVEGTMTPPAYDLTQPSIENLPDPDLFSPFVETSGTMVGHADSMGQFTHLITDKTLEGKKLFYWARLVNMLDVPSEMHYVGSATPLKLAAYNDVTVYCLSIVVPARPVGGTYDSPTPDGAVWLKSPPTERVPGSKAVIFMSNRRFCSISEFSDTEWALPAAIYDPNETTIVEPSKKPTGVIVTAGFSSIRVTWDAPNYEGHKKTQIFVQRVSLDASDQPRHPPSLNVDTMLAGESTTNMISISAASGYGYYVWARNVNNVGAVGDLSSLAGSFIVVKIAPDDMSHLLDGQIKFDFLNTDVKGALDKAASDAQTALDNTQETLDKALQAIEAATASKSLATTTANTGLKLIFDVNRIESERRVEWYGPSGVQGQLKAFEARVEGEGGEIKKLYQAIETAKGGASSGLQDLSESLSLLDSSMATKISEIYAKFRDVDASSMASISGMQAAISDANKAVATLDQTVKANKTAADNAMAAEVSARKMAITDEAGSRAIDVATLNSSISGVNAKVNSEITNRQESVATLTQSVSSLDTRLTGSFSTVDGKVTTEIADRKTAITGVNSSISALDTRLTGSVSTLAGTVNTEISDRKSAVTGVNSSISALDTRLSGSLTTLTGTVNTEIVDRKTAITGVNSSISALDTRLTGSVTSLTGAVNTEISDRKTAVTGINNSISSLDTRLTGSVAAVDSKTTTEISDRKTAITGVNSSISALDTRLSGSLTSLTGAVNTEISDRKTAIVGVNSAISSLDSRLTSSVATERDRITAEIADRKTAISNEQWSRSALESSLTSSINGVSANVTSLSSSFATLDGKYSAQWGVKTTVGALTGGIGFVNDGSTTSFLVDANVFALISTSSTGSVLRSSPFKVVNGRAYIADAYIDSATINTIVARQITADYINAMSITAGNISANSTISAPNISGGTISIGSKFSVDADGKVTANGVSISGDIQAPNIKGGNLDGAVIRGGSIRGANIQASRFVVDSGMQVLSWANQEAYGTMDLPTIVSRYGNDAPFVCDYDNVTGNVSASTSLGTGVMAAGATYKAGLTFPIASYNDPNRAKTFRYSRKLISPTITCLVKSSPYNPGAYAELTLTFKVYCGSNVVWSWRAPKVGQNGSGGSIKPGSGVTWAMSNGTCTCSYTQYVENYTYGTMAKGEYLYVLNLTDMPFYGDGPMDVAITVDTMHSSFNDNAGNIIVFTIQDQANNSSQPTGVGPS
jgi:predicted phage tail protein